MEQEEAVDAAVVRMAAIQPLDAGAGGGEQLGIAGHRSAGASVQSDSSAKWIAPAGLDR